MLKLEGVSLGYGSYQALHHIDLHADDGELVVLLGANGAGKSSTFLGISGLLKARSGRIRFSGRDLVGMKPSSIVELGVVHCPEGRKLFPALTVLQNLMLGAYVHRHDHAGIKRALDDVLALFPVLDAKRNAPAGSLSGGQQQMVAIGRALMSRPRALLLDEPSLGLAPLVVKQMFEIIQAINRSGVTVLLAEQNAHSALRIAHRGYVLEDGHVVLEGARDALMNNDSIRAAYIGA
jgi:branched-chain amino acid transport system ATP-binding protein